MYKLQERGIAIDNNVTVKDLKALSNNEAHTSYQLLTHNCHKYAFDIEMYLNTGEKIEN